MITVHPLNDYVHRLHYAEGAASLPLVILPIASSFGKMVTPLRRRGDYELGLCPASAPMAQI